MNKLVIIMTVALAVLIMNGCQDSPQQPASSAAPSAAADPVETSGGDKTEVPDQASDPQAPASAAEPASEVESEAAASPDQTGEAVEPIAPEEKTMEASNQAQSSSGMTEAFLNNQRFVLKKINEADFTGGRVPYILFEGENNFLVRGRVCNNFRGPGKVENGVLSVRNISSTKMACTTEGLGDLENSLFKMLESGAEISMDGQMLKLKYRNTTLTFEATDEVDSAG